MGDHFNIQYLTHSQINKKKWDACIEHSSNGLIYGYSFFLDQMAKHWDALVLNDYEAVMPLTWNKKYGIYYLYQPFLTAQTGVFGNNITAGIVTSFLKTIPSKFKYWDFCLNHCNVFPLKEFDLHQRSNFVLNLDKPYSEIYATYRENIQRNIKKAEQSRCIVEKGFNVERVIKLAILQMQSQGNESAENVNRFRNLYQQLHAKQMAITYGIVSATSELLASCVFFFSHNRAFYILVGNHPDGKIIGASHALIDAFIKDYAGKKMVLDFEGSDISSLAHFYSGFGAVNEIYAGIKVNRLAFYLKWMKR
jgi:hypothetical protein